jgi:hypothetical protein
MRLVEPEALGRGIGNGRRPEVEEPGGRGSQVSKLPSLWSNSEITGYVQMPDEIVLKGQRET